LVIERCSRRCCAARDRDAVIGAVTLEVTKVWLAGRPVRSFWGLVKTIAARVARKLRRRRSHAQLTDGDALAAPAEPLLPWQPTPEEVLERVQQLHGSRQRWLVQQLALRRSIQSLADELEWPVGEVNDQLRGVAALFGVAWSAEDSRGSVDPHKSGGATSFGGAASPSRENP